jgi:hypothetical protein
MGSSAEQAQGSTLKGHCSSLALGAVPEYGTYTDDPPPGRIARGTFFE